MQTYTNTSVNQNNFPKGKIFVQDGNIVGEINGQDITVDKAAFEKWLADTKRLDSVIIYPRNGGFGGGTLVATSTVGDYWDEYPHDVIILDVHTFYLNKN